MDGFTDELMTGRQTSLTTEKNVPPLSLSCNTDLNFKLINGKMAERICLKLHFLPVKLSTELTSQLHCEISDSFKAVVKGGYSFGVFKHGCTMFSFEACFLKQARLWRLTYKRYVLHAFMLIWIDKMAPFYFSLNLCFYTTNCT